MPHAYTEDQLVEQPAIGLFAGLGWAVAGPPPNAGVAGDDHDDDDDDNEVRWCAERTTPAQRQCYGRTALG